MKVVERNRYNDKGEVFQKRVLTFEPFKYDQIESVVEKIQNNLSGDLLKGKRLKYAADVGLYQYYGHCYYHFALLVASAVAPVSTLLIIKT